MLENIAKDRKVIPDPIDIKKTEINMELITNRKTY